MILKSKPTIKKNVRVDDYVAVDGSNKYWLTEDDGKVVATYTANVRWQGKGSPYPTPPGGPWKMRFVKGHPKFGDSWIIDTDRESDVMAHLAVMLSNGCFIFNKTPEGFAFFAELMKVKDELTAIQEQPIDVRNAIEKKAHPIDYATMTKKIT
jgi:hypothetical protein